MISEQMPISKVHRPKEPNIPKDMPLVSWHPWTDVRKRDDIRRLNITFPFGVMPTKWTLKIRQSYYAAAMYIDELIGILLSYVDMQKTIIVLTSDHGKHDAIFMPWRFTLPAFILNSSFIFIT